MQQNVEFPIDTTVSIYKEGVRCNGATMISATAIIAGKNSRFLSKTKEFDLEDKLSIEEIECVVLSLLRAGAVQGIVGEYYWRLDDD